MNVKDWLDNVGYIGDSEITDDDAKVYYSKYDKSYITRVGMEDNVEFLADREITEQLTHGVGFSPKDNKWWGWSHRAIFGFTIGSTCEKGDAHYHGSTLEEQEEAAIRFWTEADHLNVRNNGIVKKNGEQYFDIVWEYSDTVPNESLRNTISGVEHFITPLGRGEWVAKTMDDAKQMAVDFNEGVS